MKNIIRKTDSQIEAENSYSEVSVEETQYFYWSCEECGVAFFKGDVILEGSVSGYMHCPLKKGFLKGYRKCLNHIYGGDEKCFNKYYKLAPMS